MVLNITTAGASNGTPVVFVADFEEPVQSLVKAAYIALTLINIFGNGLMCYIIFIKRNLHSPQNYLLFNLSVADIVGAFGVYPYVFTNKYPKSVSELGQTLSCAVIRGQIIYFISVGTSLANLCAISWHRFFAIRYPLKTIFQLSRTGAVKLAVIVWVSMITLSVPFWTYYDYIEDENVCVGKTENLIYRIYGTFILVFAFCIPISFLMLSLIALQLITRQNTTGLHEVSFRRRTEKIEKAEKVVKFLIINLIVSWLAFLIYWALKSFTNYFPPGEAGQVLRRKWVRMTLLMSIMNGSLDPILFYFGSSKIRTETCIVLAGLCRSAGININLLTSTNDSEGTQPCNPDTAHCRSAPCSPLPVIPKHGGEHYNLAFVNSVA